MSLEDRLDKALSYPAAEDVTYTPRTVFDGVKGTIQTGPLREEPKDYTELLKQFGHDPAEVRIVGSPRVSRWEQRSRIRGTAEYETIWLSAYKYDIAAIGATADLDIEAIAKRAKKVPRLGSGAHWAIFQAGDLQIGKRSRDGSSAEILERYFESLERFVDEFKAAKRLGIEGIQVSMPGDCIEGIVSQSARNLWLTQETITEQTRIFRRLIMATVEAVAPLVDQVKVTVVNGNHDEAQRAQNMYPGDGWATECATSVADALSLNPAAYSHCDVLVPDKWNASMTVAVGDTVVTVIHGHQWRNPTAAMKWWSEQALHHQPAGGAHVLQHGHYHSWQVETTEHRTRIQSPTYDCGSDYYRDRHGAMPRRGGLSYLLSGGAVSRMSIV
jgi:predicted phosphodiesterase